MLGQDTHTHPHTHPHHPPPRPTPPHPQLGALGDLGYEHQALLTVLTDEVVPSRMAEFSLDHLTDVVEAMNKLGYGPRAGLGGLGRRQAASRRLQPSLSVHVTWRPWHDRCQGLV